MLRGAPLLLLLCLVGACRRTPVEPGPAEAVLNFLEALKQVHGDSSLGDRAVRLMDQSARENLAERARRASALSGRQVSIGEMLAPSFFSLHQSPLSTEVRRVGDSADVTVLGRDGRRAVVRTTLEEGHWKVVLELPALSPIRQRESAESDDYR